MHLFSFGIRLESSHMHYQFSFSFLKNASEFKEIANDMFLLYINNVSYTYMNVNLIVLLNKYDKNILI